MGVNKEFIERKVCESYGRTGSLEQTAIEMMTTHGCYGWPTSVSRVLKRNQVSRGDPWRPSKVKPLIKKYGEDLSEEIKRFPDKKGFGRFNGVSEKTVYRALEELEERGGI